MKAKLVREHGKICLHIESENETEGIALEAFSAQKEPGYLIVTDAHSRADIGSSR